MIAVSSTSGVDIALVWNAIVVIIRITGIDQAIAVLIVLARVVFTVGIAVRAASSVDVAFVRNAITVVVRIARINYAVVVGVRLA